MRDRALMGLAVGTLLVAMLPGVASAAKVTAKTDCKNGAWEDLVDAEGQPFADKAACTSYAKDGGTPTPPTLAIAYTNLDGEPGFGPSDQLIARLLDTDSNGLDPGDELEMGRYPTSRSDPYDFADWGVTNHVVTIVNPPTFDPCCVKALNFDSAEGHHIFTIFFGLAEAYEEGNAAWTQAFQVLDGFDASGYDDTILADAGSPSAPSTTFGERRAPHSGDDPFVNVEIFD